MKNKLVLLIGVILLCFIGPCVYFVGNVSATLPPIETFNYQGNMQELLNKIKILETINSNIKIANGNMLGNKFNGFAYDIELEIKNNSHDLLYNIKIEAESLTDTKSEFKLIGAHDLYNNSGGYGIKADGMNNLLAQFNLNIISPLKSKGIILIRSK